jgi:TonB family protein
MSALADVLGPMIYNLLAWTVQASILAAAAAGIGRLMPHSRGRLFFLQMVLLVGLVLPAVEPWSKPAGHAAGAVTIATGPVTVLDGAPSRFHFQWKPEYLLWLAAAGAGVRLLWILVGFARLRAYRNSALRLEHPPVPFECGNVSWYVSEIVTSPVTFGWTKASILLPARVMELPDDLREAIACHELIHVERRDWLFVLAEEILRALLWFQPGIWILLAEIQLAREQVVDGEVIRLMRDRERYLDALLAVAAYKFQPDLAPAPLFLKKRHLAARVATLLKETRMSKAKICAGFAGACSAVVAAALIAIAFFPLQSTAQTPAQTAATVADGPGVAVLDTGIAVMHRDPVSRPSGSDLLGGTVIVQAMLDSKGEVIDARVISGPEEFRRATLQSVLQWHYVNQPAPPASVEVQVKFVPLQIPENSQQPNYRTADAAVAARSGTLKYIEISGASADLVQKVRDALPVREGDQIGRTNMPQISAAVRQIDEHFRVGLFTAQNGEATLWMTLAAPPAAGATDGPQAALASPPQRIRVGSNVQQANLITKVTPPYPPDAKEARIQGVVNLAIIIGKDGTVQKVEVLSGEPLLTPAAMDAVKQWVYKPTLLNGNPVEVVTQVDVTFTLSQ